MSYDDDEMLVEERSFRLSDDEDPEMDVPLEDLEPADGIDLNDDDDEDPDASFH